jgi:hypothetical protein
MSEIDKALLKAQAHFGSVKKGSTNLQYRSKYADLTSVVEAVAGPLNDAGITFRWTTAREEHGWVITCYLTHAESGEEVHCAWPVIASKQDAQGFASGSTYARRYSLLAVTGIPTEDDDGNAAVKSTGQSRSEQVRAELEQRRAKQVRAAKQAAPDTVAPGYPRRGEHDGPDSPF